MTILERIVERKRAEVAARMQVRPLVDLRRDAAAAADPPDFAGALRGAAGAGRRIAAIAEIKRRSPSKGVLRADLDPADLAQRYAAGGASALSVLTDADFFGGSDADLRAAVTAGGIPALRKDFTIDAYQLHEARLIGASAVLLIVRILDDERIRALLALAGELRLAALVEVHDRRELERAVACGAELIGVNNRNLDTFEVALETSLELRGAIPPGALAVAESGIHTPADVARLAEAGFDALLVGESLVTAADPGARLRDLLGGGSR